MSGVDVSRRLVTCVGLLLAVAVAVVFAVDRQQQTFAAFGASKRITLPLTYAVFVLAATLPARHKREGSRPRVPAWIWMPAVGTAVSSFGIAVLPTSQSPIDAVLQGVALFGGFSLLAWFGLGATEWDERSCRRLVWILLGGSLFAGVMQTHGVTPFVALSVPGFFAALILTMLSPGRRLLYLSLAAALGYLVVRSIRPDSAHPTSAAVLGQVAVCAAVVVLFLVPKTFRPLIAAVSALLALVVFVQRGGMDLLAGNFPSTDITIAQRSYEAAQVMELFQSSVWATLVGLGPGATVNLSTSPDAQTLFSSGRDVYAVDDVHLLTAYLMLKLGTLGLVWLGLLFLAVIKAASIAYRPSPQRAWRLVLLLFVVAGVVNALPAATNLLVNPLVPLFLGVLWTSALGSNPGKRGKPGQGALTAAMPS